MDIGVCCVQHVIDYGWVVLRGVVSPQWVDECAAAFHPRMCEYIGRKGANNPETRNRGPFRHYIDLPMCRPFSTLMVGPGAYLAVAVAVMRSY